MEELKLFVITFRGPEPCFKLQVARSPQEAFLQCYNTHSAREGADKASCKVEEAAVQGYDIVVRPTAPQ